MAFSICLTTGHIVDTLDLYTAFWYCGKATADKIPMIKTTTSSSMSVKPRFKCLFFILFLLGKICL